MKDALGHGSDPRGGADHQSGVTNLGRGVSVSSKVLDIIRNSPNGFSVTPTGQVPTSGFMVSLPGHSMFLPINTLGGPRALSVLQQYANAHAVPLREPGAHLGGWHDMDAGHVVLDVSHNIRDKATALRLGHERNQIAIWDVKHGREIKTGGTGDAHG